MPTFVSSILALSLATSVAAQELPYPAKELLEAFRDACGAIEDQESTSARLMAVGWRKLSREEEVGPLGEFLTFSRKAGKAVGEAENVEMGELESFASTIAGETVYIILDEVRSDGVRINGCQLYDFEETRPILPELVEKWLGREPEKVFADPDVVRAEWSPGTRSEHDSFKVFFVPANSAVKPMLHFSGIALMSDTIGTE